MRMALKQKTGTVMCVLNRANPKAAKRGYQLKEKQAEELLETKFAKVIPEDRLLGLTDSMPPAARRYSPAGRAVRRLAKSLLEA